VQSLSEVVELYGAREGESVGLWDAMDRYFALGGGRACIKRIFGEGAPLAAFLELETAAKTKVLVVTAKYKGTLGNNIKLEVVENVLKTKTKLVIKNGEGEVLETSGEYAKASELLKWGEEHTTYVTITKGSNYVAGEGELVKALVATKLASGANPTVNATSTIASIETLTKVYGPGQLVVLGTSSTEEAVHTVMAENGIKYRRDAQADLKGASELGTPVATLKSEKGTVATGVAERINFFASALIAPGVAGGTTRTIPASIVAAALFAKVARTGNNNQAPAGIKWPLGPAITGILNVYTEAQMTSLEESGINCFAEVNGVQCLYGAASALPASKNEILCQYPAVREVMALEAEAEEQGQQYNFDNITNQTIGEFAGDLAGIIKRHKESKALEGGEVKSGSPINTPETARLKQLNAEMVVVIAGTAVTVKVRVTSTSNVETI
jgi:hypothetical protein